MTWFYRALDGLSQRISLLLTRCNLEEISDADGFQVVKISGVQDIPGLEALQPGGISHNPGAGAEGLLVRFGGGGSHGVVIFHAQRGRPKALDGELLLYTVGENGGTKMRFAPNGDIYAKPASKLFVDGDLHVTGDVVAKCNTTAVSLVEHPHPTAMGPSGKPVPTPPLPPDDLAIP